MQHNSTETASEVESAHEKIIWDIAFWVVRKYNECEFGLPSTELPEFARKILADNVDDVKLQELLAGLDGDSEYHWECMNYALLYVTKGFTKRSSVYPGNWLSKYQQDVKELPISATAFRFAKQFGRIADNKKAVTA